MAASELVKLVGTIVYTVASAVVVWMEVESCVTVEEAAKNNVVPLFRSDGNGSTQILSDGAQVPVPSVTRLGFRIERTEVARLDTEVEKQFDLDEFLSQQRVELMDRRSWVGSVPCGEGIVVFRRVTPVEVP
jgi:hypothetical protein